MVKPYKPPSVALEQKLDEIAKPEPTPAPIKVKTLDGTPVTGRERVKELYKIPASNDLSSVIVQLQNIWEKVCAIELMVTAQYAVKTKAKPASEVVDDTYPPTTNGGHPIVKGPNGMVKPAPFIEVPTVEQLLARATKFKDKHGKEALVALVQEFEVKKISELTDEQRGQFMEKLNG